MPQEAHTEHEAVKVETSSPLPAKPTVCRFMILMPWGRVGSNLIMSIIRQAARAKLANEKLARIKGESEQVAWYEKFYELGTASPKKFVIGSKQHVLALANPGDMARRLVQDDIKVIRMRRDNILKTAISYVRAEHYAELTRRKTGKARWGVLEGEQALGPIIIDTDVLFQRLKTIQQAHDLLMNLLPHNAVLDVEYIEVAQNLKTTVEKISDWLSIPIRSDFRVKFEKATPDDLMEAIVNYDEVRHVLSGTEYFGQLEV